MNNIVVTGGTGFVGSNLSRYLTKKKFNIHLIVRKSSSFDNIKDLVSKINIFTFEDDVNALISLYKKIKPIVTIHLATNFIVNHNQNDLKGLIKSNIEFGNCILEAMKLSKCKNIINVGTNWQHYNDDLYNPTCLYAATKQAFEAIIKYYVEAENFKVITLKLFDTYGENDKRPKLINLLSKFSKEKTELELSPGFQKLKLVHVDDVCEAFHTALLKIISENNISHQIYAVDSNEVHSLKDIISLFEEISKTKLNIKWGKKPYRKREMMNPWSHGVRLHNWMPKISLKNGLLRIINNNNNEDK